MITFILSLLLLIAGYFLYGRYVEKVFTPEHDRVTPALQRPDGVDYVPMSSKKIFLIQFLNIAGLGPIFGAIMGAMYGPVVFLWIVFG
ncbi:MAG: carbon starvation CstA family protein, partial [Bacteroidales bacterium]